jgi:hypothetical protein
MGILVRGARPVMFLVASDYGGNPLFANTRIAGNCAAQRFRAGRDSWEGFQEARSLTNRRLGTTLNCVFYKKRFSALLALADSAPIKDCKANAFIPTNEQGMIP